MSSVSHVDDGKKELVKDVHRLARLGVWLEYSSKGCSMVNYNSKSSLVVEVKQKYLDPLLMRLKESALSKFNEAFSQGGMGYLGTKIDCVCQMWMT